MGVDTVGATDGRTGVTDGHALKIIGEAGEHKQMTSTATRTNARQVEGLDEGPARYQRHAITKRGVRTTAAGRVTACAGSPRQIGRVSEMQRTRQRIDARKESQTAASTFSTATTSEAGPCMSEAA